ncbi:unnamed protein product [Chrysodeixis includens]|uniref:Uncharacterized protein n=1 Tax=Chrysodeixis includens TaxID=689277 RepID=A0A9N8Q0Q1_CHRIL|nr:unnamed protein product [Chrysodeixis includens]
MNECDTARPPREWRQPWSRQTVSSGGAHVRSPRAADSDWGPAAGAGRARRAAAGPRRPRPEREARAQEAQPPTNNNYPSRERISKIHLQSSEKNAGSHPASSPPRCPSSRSLPPEGPRAPLGRSHAA